MESIAIKATVNENLSFLKDFFGSGIDLVESNYEILDNKTPVGVAYIESITDAEIIRKHLVRPLLQCRPSQWMDHSNLLLYLRAQLISATNIKQTNDLSDAIREILNGNAVLFVENANAALVIGSRKVEKRSIGVPENESTVLGSQESFTDDIKTNMSLMIKRLPVPELRSEEFSVGTLTQTTCKLIWLEGVTNPTFIEEARKRLQNVNIDNINGVGTLAEVIEDKPISFFPKYRQTERPDVAAKNLCDGRFVILCNNSPFAMIAPAMFWDNFRTMDDYEERPLVSSYLRLIRYLAFLLSSVLSSLYLSFVTYNQAIVPPTLSLSIASGREGVPFPSIVELLLLTVMISVIREAGLRMHGSVGYFVGALAAVVIGQAVVMAGYVSSALIIVVAISTIASFAISTTTLLYPARLLNYFFILFAGAFGIFGVITGVCLVLWHLCSLYTFGVPYLYPLIPYNKEGFKDIFIRPPFRYLRNRMKLLSPNNIVRSKNRESKQG